MEKWVIAAKRADFNQIGQQFHIDPVIARLIRNRDVSGEDKIREYLSGTVQELPSPWLMKDMEKAAEAAVTGKPFPCDVGCLLYTSPSPRDS